jgi:radical SAM protein with 4Fe4S-binding SPASM domain
LKKSVCPFPFYQLFLNPNGKVAPCCYLSQETSEDLPYHVGDIKDSSLEEIWNSEKMRELRRQFIEGNPKICEKYIGINRCNLIRKDLLEGIELSETPPFPMKKLDLMLNGKCNLECTMCDVWKMPNDVYSKNGFWEEGPKKIFPFLEEIDCKGGEPFIQKDIYRLIDEVSKVNPECKWHFTTNGHYSFNDKLRSYLNKIKLVRVSVSIDSLNPGTYAKIRKKGDLLLAWRTFNDWITYSEFGRTDKRFPININMVVQKENWQEVPEFIRIAKLKGVSPFFIPLTRPEEFSIFKLSVSERIEIIEYYFKSMRIQKDRVYLRLITSILESLPPETGLDIKTRNENAIFETRGYGPSIAEVDF